MKDLLQVEIFQEELNKVMMSPNYQEVYDLAYPLP